MKMPTPLAQSNKRSHLQVWHKTVRNLVSDILASGRLNIDVYGSNLNTHGQRLRKLSLATRHITS